MSFRIVTVFVLLFLTFQISFSAISDRTIRDTAKLSKELKLIRPENGFVSGLIAKRWEESLVTGNGTIGALVRGIPGNDIIILSHEKLFMPLYPPTKAPNLKKYLKRIRELILNGRGDKAAELAVKAGKEVGIDDVVWTNPLVPACQLEIKSHDTNFITAYAKQVNYETGEVTVGWKTAKGIFHESMFVSRPAGVAVLRLKSPTGSKLNFDFRFNNLPFPDKKNDENEEFIASDLIADLKIQVNGHFLTYITRFKKQWPGSLKGYNVTAKIYPSGGEIKTNGKWLEVTNTNEILILADIRLYYENPIPEGPLNLPASVDYEKLLTDHAKVHGEMFNRLQLNLTGIKKHTKTAEQLLAESSPGHLKNELVEQLCQAARYILISSTGELPPTLQGIWGGTWLPAWSSDFTLNGNVESAIACGLNGNFEEATKAYLNYMFSMFQDFKDNAHDLYGVEGIFVPSRVSTSGKTYHYLKEYPHLFWFAGAAWTAEFFYDYWLYSGDEQFLREKTIPFMKEAIKFYEDILVKNNNGKLIFNPSYSPENHPPGYGPATINATMDVAALKQLLRNLIRLADKGYIEKEKIIKWQKMIDDLPEYQIDEKGDLKEWLWPEFRNNNKHRHASHLYPLFYEVDPEFEENPELKKAAIQAIENRLAYRRSRNGGEMAFGLVQLGLAAAHLHDVQHAYECVDWLCNSYWSPSFTSFHNPGEIFNVDICGGLPAVVIEMILQSSPESIELLPALPDQWPNGSIKGVRTRCGVTVDLEWSNGVPVKANLVSRANKKITIRFHDKEWPLNLKRDKKIEWKFQLH